MKTKDIDIPLSGQQIIDLFKDMNDRPNLAPLDDVKIFDNPEKFFKNSGHCVFFAKNKNSSIGHWIGCIRKGKDYYFADSLGESPNKYNPNFAKMILKNGGKLYFNDKQIQKDTSNSCGRHAILACIINKIQPTIPLVDATLKVFDKKFNMDDFVLKNIKLDI